MSSNRNSLINVFWIRCSIKFYGERGISVNIVAPVYIYTLQICRHICKSSHIRSNILVRSRLMFYDTDYKAIRFSINTKNKA